MNSISTSIFLLPRGWKCDFQRFFNFGRGRNAVFFIFKLSAAAEMQFSPFFVFRPWRKADFRHFFSFGRGGNTVFTVFYLSAVVESRFSAFSHFHPWMTGIFSRFSRFVGRRQTLSCDILHFVDRQRAAFIVFRISGHPEDPFFKFFRLRDSPKNFFSDFLSFGAPRKPVFQIF